MKQISEAIQKREDLIKGNISSQFQLRQLDDEFEKGKSLPIGTIREHGGKKKQKKADGSWVPVSGKKEKRETVTVGGRDYGVKTFDSVDEANKFMEQNKEWGVIKEHGGKIYVAKKKDMGEKRDSKEPNYDYYTMGYDNTIQFGYVPDPDKMSHADTISYVMGSKDGRERRPRKNIDEFERTFNQEA